MANGKEIHALVPRMADLAKLELTADEKKRLASEFERVVEYVGQVQEVDAPVTPLTATISGVQQVLRDDTVMSSFLADALLQCAPEIEKRHVRVPSAFAGSQKHEDENRGEADVPRSLGEGGQASDFDELSRVADVADY